MYPILNLALFFVLSTTPAFASSQAGEVPLAAQEHLTAYDGPLWTGKVREDLAPHLARIFTLGTDDIDEELARIRLALLAHGDCQRAVEESTALWMRVARTSNPDAAEQLARAVAVRGWVLSEAGRQEEALAALGTPLPTREEIWKYYMVRGIISHLDPDSRFHQAMAEAIAADPAVVSLREMLQVERTETSTFVERCREKMGEESYRYVVEHFGSPTDEIAALALDALGYNNTKIAKKLGAQAVSVAAYVTLADPDGAGLEGVTSNATNLSVRSLLDLDRARALQLFTECFHVGEAMWRSRILEACKSNSDLHRSSAWVPFPPTMSDQERIGGRLWTPEWTPLLALLLSDEQTREESLELVQPYANHDAFTPELQEALGKCIRADDQPLAAQVLATVDDDGTRVRSAFPVYVAGMESPFPDIRRTCAWRLSSFKAVEELVAFARDRDPEVRRAVARVFRTADVALRPGTLSNVRILRPEQVTVTSELIPVIEALLADETETVRQEAEAAIWTIGADRQLFPDLVESSEPWVRRLAVSWLFNCSRLTSDELALVRRLLRDPDPGVRSYLAKRNNFDDRAAQKIILTTLTSDTAPEVLRELDAALSGSSSRHSTWKTTNLTVIPMRLTNPVVPFEPRGGGEAGWMKFAQEKQIRYEEAPFLLTLALERGYDELVAHQLGSLIEPLEPAPAQPQPMLGSWGFTPTLVTTHDQDRFPDACLLRELEPPVRCALYAWHDARHEIGKHEDRKLREELVWKVMLRCAGSDEEAVTLAIETGDVDHSWVRSILSTPDRQLPGDRELRERVFLDDAAPLSLRLAAGAGIDVLELPGWEPVLDSLLQEAAREQRQDELGKMLRRSERGNEYVLRVLNENLLSGEPLRVFADWSFDNEVGEPGSDAAALAILDRWLEVPGEDYGAVSDALDYLGESLLVYKHPGYILTAARDWRYVGDALAVMSNRRLPEFVEPLCGMFGRDWPALTASNVDQVRYEAAMALSEYEGREVIDFLSSILFEVEGEVRESVIEALENLRRYEELRAAWRRSPLPEREEALIELVEMLSSDAPPIRAAAARGIATFGAIEAIPRLIRLLEDESEVVRVAAEKALEQLYALPPKVEREEEGAETEEE